MGKAIKRPAMPEFTALADDDIVKYGGLIDLKCLVIFIRETHGLAVSEFDIVMRAAELRCLELGAVPA